jgi:hypothetical protein
MPSAITSAPAVLRLDKDDIGAGPRGLDAFLERRA